MLYVTSYNLYREYMFICQYAIKIDTIFFFWTVRRALWNVCLRNQKDIFY